MAATMLAMSSCGDRLNLAPTNQIDQSSALQTSSDVQAALLGSYNRLGSYYVLGGQVQMSADLLANNGDVAWGGTFVQPGQFNTKNILVNNSYTSLIWTDSYATINICNNILANLDKVTEANRARFEGEARFIRGTVYFNLVRLFAKTWGDGDNTANPGVPLVLTPTTVINDQSYVARNSVAQVYAQVIDDLTKAESALPATAYTTTAGKMTGQATKWAAAGMLSRVYLMQLDYTNAAAAANRVIQSGVYQLNADYEASFNLVNQNSPENIFSTQVTSQAGDNSLRTFYSVNERGDITITNNLFAQFEDGDARGEFFAEDGGSVYSLKFNTQYSNVPILRLAEMYLTRAEANFRLNTSTGATPLADVNRIRNRAGLANLTTVNLNAILKERKLELLFEGELLHDLKRTRRTVGSLAFNANNLVMPIPFREMQVNNMLVQNPGYN